MAPEKFMARAIEIGRTGLRTKDARPFAAVVVRQGKIVGEGRSQQKTLLDPTAHGEIVAIRDACRRLGTTDLSGCELYTMVWRHVQEGARGGQSRRIRVLRRARRIPRSRCRPLLPEISCLRFH